MGWSFEKSSSCSWQEQEIFPLSKASKPALGSNQSPIQWVSRVKKPGLETDNQLQSSAEVKIEQNCFSILPYSFTAYTKAILYLPPRKFKFVTELVSKIRFKFPPRWNFYETYISFYGESCVSYLEML